MKKEIIAAIAMAFPLLATADGSPWLPVPGSTSLTIGYVKQAGDEFFVGTEKATLPAEIRQETYSIGAQYGLADALAIDAKLNYARNRFDAPAGFPLPNGNESALGDTSIGASWRVVDEFEHTGAPTLTLRAAVNIAGNYDVGKINAIGDKASGVDLSVLVGKYLTPKFTVAGELGYRYRNHAVPDDLWYGVNLGYSVASFVSVSAAYTVTRSRGDLDIGGAGFSPSRFPEVREDRDLVSAGASFALAPRSSLNVNYGEVIDGRNTTKETIWGVSLATSF